VKARLVNSFYPPYIGGAETYTRNLARSIVTVRPPPWDCVDKFIGMQGYK